MDVQTIVIAVCTEKTKESDYFRAILNQLLSYEESLISLNLPTYRYIPSFHHRLWNLIDINEVKPYSATENEVRFEQINSTFQNLKRASLEPGRRDQFPRKGANLTELEIVPKWQITFC